MRSWICCHCNNCLRPPDLLAGFCGPGLSAWAAYQITVLTIHLLARKRIIGNTTPQPLLHGAIMIPAKQLSLGLMLALPLVLNAGCAGKPAPIPADPSLVTNPGAEESDLELISEGVNDPMTGEGTIGLSFSLRDFGRRTDDDIDLQFFYGADRRVALSIDGSLAEHTVFRGDGLSPATALQVEGSPAPDGEVAAAFSYLNLHYPDRLGQSDKLFKDSEGRFFIRVNFVDSGSAIRLYFDVTDWARARLEH